MLRPQRLHRPLAVREVAERVEAVAVVAAVDSEVAVAARQHNG